MSRSLVLVSGLLVAIAGFAVGLLSNWTLGLGVMWFGVSGVVLVGVARSFR